MDITQAIQRIQYHWRTVEGMRPDAAPNEPTDTLDPLPHVNTYEAMIETDVSQMYSGSFAPQKGIIRSDLHLSRTNLAKTIQLGRAMCKEFQQAIQDDPNLNGTLLIVTLMRSTFMTFEFGGITTLGYRVELEYISEL